MEAVRTHPQVANVAVDSCRALGNMCCGAVSQAAGGGGRAAAAIEAMVAVVRTATAVDFFI